MKALILADDEGEDLKPFTENSPKALIEIGGTTLLDRILGCLSQIGIKEVLMVTGSLGEKIKGKFSNQSYGMSFFYIQSTQFSGRRGFPLQAVKELLKDDDFLVMKADLFFPLPALKKLSDFRESSGCLEFGQKGREIGRIFKVSQHHLHLLRLKLESVQSPFSDSLDFLWEWMREIPHHSLKISGMPWTRIKNFDDLKKAWRIVLPAIRKCETPSAFLRWDERLSQVLMRRLGPSFSGFLGLLLGGISLFLFASGSYIYGVSGALCLIFSEILNPNRWWRELIRILLFLALGFGFWRIDHCCTGFYLSFLAGFGAMIYYALDFLIQRSQNKEQEGFYIEFQRENKIKWTRQFKIDFSRVVFLFALFHALSAFLWMASIGAQLLWIGVLLLRMKEIRSS